MTDPSATTALSDREAVVAAAIAAAGNAANDAGITVRELSTLAELDQVCSLYQDIWHPEPENPPVTTELLRALVLAGSYVTGAFVDRRLIGACVGFFASPGSQTLHSHIAGVSGQVQARGVGFALKLHQRAWALRRTVTTIEWTFDPLIRRNAYFNLTKLSAGSRHYLPNFYGRVADRINAGDDTDRLLVTWPLEEERVVRACGGRPDEPDLAALRHAGAGMGLGRDEGGWPIPGRLEGRTVLVAVPLDVERLRIEDPACARAWRGEAQVVLQRLLEDGAVIDGFTRDGWYVVNRP